MSGDSRRAGWCGVCDLGGARIGAILASISSMMLAGVLATRHEWQEIDLADFPNVARWMATLAARPAVAKGMAEPG